MGMAVDSENDFMAENTEEVAPKVDVPVEEKVDVITKD